MTASEIVGVDKDLRTIIWKTGLGWVIDQVNRTIHEGRSVETQTRIFKDEDDAPHQESIFPDDSSGARRAGRATAMLRREAWSAAEKLHFLIDALRQAIVQAAEVENEQLRFLRSVAPVEAVAFEPDADAETARRWDMKGIQSDS